MNIFDSVLVKKPQRSLFNLSHEFKLTGNMGKLYPILCQEVIPGDTWKVSSEVFCRFAPLVAPIMHRVNLKINYFFVPFRLIWDEWEDFITGGKDGTSFPTKPFIRVTRSASATKLGVRSLADYLGFATVNSSADIPSGGYVDVDALPFRAVNLIWNEYFMNETIQTEKPIGLGSGQDTTTPMDMLDRCWEKDYFTSALPFVQRGEAVKLPIDDGQVDIRNVGSSLADVVVDYARDLENASSQDEKLQMRSSGGNTTFVSTENGADIPSGHDVRLKGNVSILDIANNLDGKIDGVTATINDLRSAYRLQRWLENNARAGYRYIEQILSHFGVKSSDARLQRPEYLGGYSTPIIVSEVMQNSGVQINKDGDPVGTPQANMAGKAMALDKSHYVKRFFEEHGYIIGFLSVMPRTSYQQGIMRQYTRKNRYDYYFPEFANLGEQEVYKKELFFDFAATDHEGGDSVFGYQQRYAEYRYIPSTVHGDFKKSLDFWHLGRRFNSAPALNASFVAADDIPTDVFAVTDTENTDHLWIEVYNNIKAVRPMPKYAIPTL